MMNLRILFSTFCVFLLALQLCRANEKDTTRPHIVLVMADDMGWGQTSYYDHPVLKTPNLDAMAANGLRFDRFYAGGPVCSPTRASVLTGRTHERTGVPSHGHALRLQEKTLPQALRKIGYATGHFGKWHLNGLRGPGVPILASDKHGPQHFGFDTWLSVTNFFDLNPIMSRQGEFEEFQGDSSEIIIDETLKFITARAKAKQPSFSVIWYGTPHSPWMSLDKDKAQFSDLDTASQNHYAELVAMDRSIGTLRKGLRDLGIADNTLFWFCSDNGGLPKITPETVGGLRGFKGSVYEGGIRVPGIIEWPAVITSPRVTEHPAVVMDIFPTITEITGLPAQSMLALQDGISLRALFTKELTKRSKPIPFRYSGRTWLVDNNIKIIGPGGKKKSEYELYDLASDPKEQTNLFESDPDLARRMKRLLSRTSESIDASVAGKDYPEGKVLPTEPAPRFWTTVEEYKPYFPAWKERPEYRSRLK